MVGEYPVHQGLVAIAVFNARLRVRNLKSDQSKLRNENLDAGIRVIEPGPNRIRNPFEKSARFQLRGEEKRPNITVVILF